MARLLSVNIGTARPSAFSGLGVTGIDKRPVPGPVALFDPGPKGDGASGVAGDVVCDLRHHGGSDQAVYAYASEDLATWSGLLGRPLSPGSFGENLTTEGLDISDALIGERWLVGRDCVLEVDAPRIPCRTFAGWLGERGWAARFNRQGAPGAYLRVVTPGEVNPGDQVRVLARPGHQVSIAHAFRAMSLEPALLPTLLDAGDALPLGLRRRAQTDAARR